MTDNIINIPLTKLTAWEGNVRKTQNKASIDELAASIKAHGLQQNLVVKKDGRKFAVVAGGRRLLALQQLAKAGDIEAGYEVPCRITEADDATEISLAENIVRENMHPADQFEAFRQLIDKGAPIEDVAARFGIADTVVKQRLKLSRVSPAILKAYRDEELTLEDVMAFTITDDHEAQENVLSGLETWQGSKEIRAALTENEIAATDKRVRYVTLKAYEKAGGILNRDLFSTDDAGIFIADTALLARLVTDKLDKASVRIRNEGWKWVEVHAEFGYEQKAQFQRVYPQPAPLPVTLAAEYAALETELEMLRDEWHASEDDSEEPARIGEIEQRLETIDDERGEPVFTPDQLAISGAVVTISHNGKLDIEQGLVRREDMPKKNGTSKATDCPDLETGTVKAEFSAALTESLTAHKSAALAARLLDSPDIGLAAVVHSLVLNVFRHAGSETSLKISAAAQSLQRVEGSTAFCRLEEARETWGEQIPGTPDDIWQWCLEQDQAVLLDLLTFCAACTINAVQTKADRQNNQRLEHAVKLASVLKLDMTGWFTTTADNYFGRVSKRQILAALQDARQQPPAPAWEKLPKAELAKLAERETAGMHWLPEILRI